MRALIQRVTRAAVKVAGATTAAIGPGLVILVGVEERDSTGEAQSLAQKIAQLRIFDDAQGRLNLCALDVGAQALVISQFTLYANVRRGRRPDFIQAARPETAAPLIESFSQALAAQGVAVQNGVFGAHMLVEIHNDGPVTIWFDTDELARPRRAGA